MAIHIPWRLGELLPVTWSIRSSIRKLGVVDLPANPDFTQRTQFEASIRAQHPSLREGQVHAVMGWEWPDVPPVNMNVLVPDIIHDAVVGYEGLGGGIGSLTPDFIIPHDKIVVASIVAYRPPEGAYITATLASSIADIKSVVLCDMEENTTVSLWWNAADLNFCTRPEDSNLAYTIHRAWIFSTGKPRDITLEVVPPITTGTT